VPEDQMRELKKLSFQTGNGLDKIRGSTRRLTMVLPKTERKQIAVHLELRPWDEFKLVDETKELPTFENNGKKFWVFRDPS
jgi:hypothetical protein